MSLLSQFHFKGRQEQAATDLNPAIAVTAGAGSGKTLSLVGRYLHLIERGYPLRSILAITFTEKAAREMRSRIRGALTVSPHSRTLPSGNGGIEGGSFDSARIGTIHSLCAEILRAHPAEAALDPVFEVLEEGLSAALQAESLESALAWATTDEASAALFGIFKENELRQILVALISRRLDVTNSLLPRGEGLGMRAKFASTLATHLAKHLDSETWQGGIATLAAMCATSPEDKLELARQSVLAHWAEIQQARTAQQWDALLDAFVALRKASSTQGKKENWVDIESIRAAMTDLRQIYDEQLKFLAEKSRFALDEQLAVHLPAIQRLLEQTLREYQRRKDERQALDFDDLEGLTAQLLTGHPAVRTGLQSELRAVLVDEFQDTNERQRQIVYALTGFSLLPNSGEGPGVRVGVDLFLVGDSKQSIYRFRSADVTVFRQVQADIQSAGGQQINLDLTFRAHKSLLENLNALLAPILGETDDPARPHAVPFAPLHAYRQSPVRENIRPPFVEFHLGLGESAEAGRAAAAQALAQRLRQLHETEGFEWGEMALLFRAGSGYAAYESALEAASIPFVTIAGRGFYDRPEIRDLLNALAAIADPSDDLALAGLLRSPAFALPDAEIYRLRFPNPVTNHPAKLIDSLRTFSFHPSAFSLHPFAILSELHALSGRAPAAAVLKRLLDLTHYRAILATHSNGARMIRNVEKLLADAHRSRLVSLTDFIAYVQTLRDVGMREGEAPADSTSSGVVQLMTVHKAKGLEFPLTVLADCAYEHRGAAGKIQLAADGLLFDLRDAEERHSSTWQLAARLEDDRAEAEDNRLLYVAATRAKEKLLISGHVKRKKDGTLSLAGWLEKFGLDQIQMVGEISRPQHFPLNHGLSATLYPVSAGEVLPTRQPDSLPETESPRRSDLLEPLAPTPPVTDKKTRARESDPPQRVWRVVSTTKTARAPAWLVGRLVHEALRRWYFHDDYLEHFLKPFAIESGLTDPKEIHSAIHEARRLLEHLHTHPLFTELDNAERHHEVRYDTPNGRGIIDLLYRTPAGWFIIDFKTDDVRSDAEAQSVIRQNGYDQQVARYAQAVAEQLSVAVKTRLVFLNLKNGLVIFDL